MDSEKSLPLLNIHILNTMFYSAAFFMFAKSSMLLILLHIEYQELGSRYLSLDQVVDLH